MATTLSDKALGPRGSNNAPAPPPTATAALSPDAAKTYASLVGTNQQLDAANAGLGQAQGPQGDGGYTAAFGQSLGDARAHVQQQLGIALGDISNREAGAQSATALLPGQLGQIYGPAQGKIDAQVAQSQAQLGATGLQAVAPGPNDGVGAERAAMTADQATRNSDVPMLALGNSAIFSKQRAEAQMSAQTAQQQIALEAAKVTASGNAQAQHDQFMAATGQRDALQNRAWALEDKINNPVNDPTAVGTPAWNIAKQKAQATYQPNVASAAQGDYLHTYDAAAYERDRQALAPISSLYDKALATHDGHSQAMGAYANALMNMSPEQKSVWMWQHPNAPTQVSVKTPQKSLWGQTQDFLNPGHHSLFGG